MIQANWEDIVKQQLGGYSWLLTDIDREKYKDTFDILQQAIEQEWYKSDTGMQRFQAAMKGSSFFQELDNKNIRQQIRDAVGGSVASAIGSQYMGSLMARALNYGYQGDELKREVYKEVFRRNQDGNYVNEQAVINAKNSGAYKQYETIGQVYFSKIPARQIERALMGFLTPDDILAQQRELAKTKYAHLAPMLDKGQTMEDIAATYRTQAAQLLEVDENSIDMGSADYEKAYSFNENGTKRMMTAGEWAQMIRTDSKYNWNKTQNAKNEARALGQTLAMAFGRLL